ncbi:MAG: hypothetical protein ACSHYF_09110 [Verrucomicrobiaceae bacterium]
MDKETERQILNDQKINFYEDEEGSNFFFISDRVIGLNDKEDIVTNLAGKVKSGVVTYEKIISESDQPLYRIFLVADQTP